VYFDHRLDSAGPGGINNEVAWYGGGVLLAVASYIEGTGGSVTIFNEEASFLWVECMRVCAVICHKIMSTGSCLFDSIYLCFFPPTMRASCFVNYK
jgi:hypothetical protein